MKQSPVFLMAVAVTALAALCSASWSETRHDPPDVSFEYHLDTEKLEMRVHIKEPQYQHWFKHRPDLIPEFSDEEYESADAELRAFFGEHGTVLVDGVRVSPVVANLEFREAWEENDYVNFVSVILEFGTKGLPRQVAVGWDRYDRSDPSWPLAFIEASFEYDTTGQFYQFYPAEPGVTWHRPSLPRKGATRVLTQAPPMWQVPLTSLIIFGLVAVGAALFYTRETPRRMAWGAIVTGCLAATLLSPFGVIAITPLWESKLRLPNTEQAAIIFEALHRNVYRAFDYKTEDEIYDALARSVDDGFLDTVYNEVYQSLIVQEEGGALSRVRGVEILESDVEFATDTEQPEFDIDCRWRVLGTVSHWGHSHWRTNEYQARYRVRGDATQWRIVSVDLRSQKRIGGGDGTGQPDGTGQLDGTGQPDGTGSSPPSGSTVPGGSAPGSSEANESGSNDAGSADAKSSVPGKPNSTPPRKQPAPL